MLLTVVALVAGAALLAFAADQFVLGAARVALVGRISPIVVGVVIIGFGTSSPELLVSAIAAASGDAEIAVGNVVGSNIANLSMLLGIGAVIVPISVASRTVRREAPLTVGAVAAFAIVVPGGIEPLEGLTLLFALAATLWGIMRGARGPTGDPLGPEAVELADPAAHAIVTEIVRTLAGLLGTIAGAQLLLWGAVDVADRAGLAEGFVGATLVALGTSLPELVTVVQSARRGETDLIVGNLLGSNLFNSFGVTGVVGVIGVDAVEDRALTLVGPLAAVAVAVLAAVAMLTRGRVERWEGAVLVVIYVATVPLLT